MKRSHFFLKVVSLNSHHNNLKNFEFFQKKIYTYNEFYAPLTCFSYGKKAIYGEKDTRVDVAELSNDPNYCRVMENAKSVCILSDNTTARTRLGEVIESMYGYPVHDSVRFQNQFTQGFGTGFLVSPSIVATARHCVSHYNSASIKSLKFTFGFWEQQTNRSSQDEEVLKCYTADKILEMSTGEEDWALVKLTQEITELPTVKIGLKRNEEDDALYMLGHPFGLPLKHGVGKIKRILSHAYSTNLPAFQGNSGSPVFNLNHEVIGVLVRGEEDYSRNLGAAAIKEMRYPEGAHGEIIQKIKPISASVHLK